MQLSLSRHADLPDAPLVMDLARTEEQRQIFRLVFARQPMGRPFLAPPGLPAERVAVLRRAFMATLQDREFLAEAARTKLEINPVSGERVQAIVDHVDGTNVEARTIWQAHEIDGVTRVGSGKWEVRSGDLVEVGIRGVEDDYDLRGEMMRVVASHLPLPTPHRRKALPLASFFGR